MVKAQFKDLFLTVAFLLMIAGVGLIQAGIEIAGGENPLIFSLFRQRPTAAGLRSLEKDMENANWLSQLSQPWMRCTQFALLKETGDKALMGRESWFFYRPSVQYLVEPWPLAGVAADAHGDAVSAIRTFRDRLAERGIQLLLIPAPGKESIYPQYLTARAYQAKTPVYEHTRTILKQLREAGVEILDLYTVYKEAIEKPNENRIPFYLSQDTHWSPTGLELAAQAAALRILERGWIKKGTSEYRLKPITLQRQGDIVRMINLPSSERIFTPEEVHCAQVIRSDNGELYRDSPDAEILVMGDSFLRIFERDEPKAAGFIAHLAYELRTPLTSIVSDGGASTLVRQELSRKSALLAGKKLVIWEFADRDIRFGTEGWQDVPLPAKAQ